MRAAVAMIAVWLVAAGCAAPSATPPAQGSVAAASVPPAATEGADRSPSAVPASAPLSPPPIPACPPLGDPAAGAAGVKPVKLVLPTDSRAPAQVEVTSPAGVRVLIDVGTPEDLSRPATKADILLTTHSHPDHWNDSWAPAFPGTTYPGGTFVRKDVSITAVGASHNGGSIADGTDTIFVLDVDGLRLVHFGDLGQDALNSRQLALVDRPDVAVSQFSNDYSYMSVANRKGFLQMAKVCPRLIVATHLMEGQPVAELLAATWPTEYTEARAVTIVKSKLPTRTTVLLAAGNAGYGTKLGLPAYRP